MRVAFARMASKTGASSPREELMTFNTSDVAVSRWDASTRSRVSWSSLSRKLAGGACLIGALRALGLFVRGAFTTVRSHGNALVQTGMVSTLACTQKGASTRASGMSALGQKQT